MLHPAVKFTSFALASQEAYPAAAETRSHNPRRALVSVPITRAGIIPPQSLGSRETGITTFERRGVGTASKESLTKGGRENLGDERAAARVRVRLVPEARLWDVLVLPASREDAGIE